MTRRLTIALSLAAGLLAATIVHAPLAAEPEPLHPSATMPNVAAAPSGQYYILLLKWSRDVVIGPVTARATYLDPPLYLAWLRREQPDIGQAAFEQKMAGFPNKVRIRVAYQAAERAMIHAKDWKVALLGPDGASTPAATGKRIAPADLKSGPNGDVWEDDWDYEFAAPDGLLAPASKGFRLALSGPAGAGEAGWTFGAAPGAAASADGYVVYLGAVLTGLCVALLAALYLTRPPRPSVT